MNMLELFAPSFYERRGKLLRRIAFIGFLVSFLTNFAAVLGFHWHQDQPYFLMVLLFGAFLLGLPVTLSEIHCTVISPSKVKPWEYFQAWLPRKAGYALTILVVYTTFNLAVSSYLLRSGKPYKEEGRYFLKYNGQLTPLSEQQYHIYESDEMKSATGYCMLFYLGVFYYCTYRLATKSRRLVPDEDGAA